MASRHREFVQDAIESVRLQTLDPKEYELVVVRDYDDTALERTVTELGGRSIRVAPGDIGPAIEAGISDSRGRVLAFLDDDDRFVPSKLDRVYELFQQDDGLGFFRNGYVVIDAEGRQLPHHRFRARQRREGERLGPVTLRGRERVAEMRGLPALGMDFNSSCMAIRRDLILDFMRYVEITGFRLLDDLAFYAALVSPLSLRIDPAVLTEYRIHSRNASLDPEERADPLSSRAVFSEIILPSYVKLVDATRAAGCGEVTEEAIGLLQVQRAYAALRNPSTRRSEFASFRRELARHQQSYSVKSEPRLRHALWLFSAAPSIGRWMYAREIQALFT